MSLGLPEFGSRHRRTTLGPWRAIRILGFILLVAVAAATAAEWRQASAERQSLERTFAEAAAARRSAEESRRALQKNSDVVIAAQSLESAPGPVLLDLESLLPSGVTIMSVRIDYQAEGFARLDFAVVAQTPDAYDRFLNALSNSTMFAEIKPGSESRPGSVRATVTALHRPRVKGVDDPSARSGGR